MYEIISLEFDLERLREEYKTLLSDLKHLEQYFISLIHETLIPVQAIVADAWNLQDKLATADPDKDSITNGLSRISGRMEEFNLFVENMRSQVIDKGREPEYVFRRHRVEELVTECCCAFRPLAEEKQL